MSKNMNHNVNLIESDALTGEQIIYNGLLAIARSLEEVAAAMRMQAEATDGLLCGLKYSKKDGMSIAEAIEVAAREIAGR